MTNPFIETNESDSTDNELVESAVSGNKKSLELLVKRHQAWIYNIALKMVWDPVDAEDVTQETLIRIITKLSTFRQESSFRTWAYRIAANYVINMKKRRMEFQYSSLEKYGSQILNSPDTELPDQESVPVDVNLLIEETKIGCMNAILLCLDREQRLIFILGNMFNVTDAVGSEIMEMSKDNFRQKLSRARKQLSNFMNDKCGLMNKDNPCHCSKKTKLMMDAGHVNPENLLFSKNYLYTIEKVTPEKVDNMNTLFEDKATKLFREHPFQQSPDFVKSLNEILSHKEFRNIFNFN
ncbi:MAG TPA: RNA polymerase sigma factor [Ignavibacteria bacterium]|nr:RNA polymerase sigma factor [Ignavibacteria bacterium]